MKPTLEIVEVSDAELAFPAHADRYINVPIPKRHLNRETPWTDLFLDIFFGHIRQKNNVVFLLPKLGVDGDKAWRMVNAWMGSYALRHERKEAGAAFMLEEFFDSFLICEAFGDYKPATFSVGISYSDPDLVEPYRQILRDILDEHPNGARFHCSAFNQNNDPTAAL